MYNVWTQIHGVLCYLPKNAYALWRSFHLIENLDLCYICRKEKIIAPPQRYLHLFLGSEATLQRCFLYLKSVLLTHVKLPIIESDFSNVSGAVLLQLFSEVDIFLKYFKRLQMIFLRNTSWELHQPFSFLSIFYS